MDKKKSNECFVNLTFKCNDNCISCIMPKNNRKYNKNLKSIIIKANSILKNSDHIDFNGGEPTISPFLFNILRYVLKKRPDIEIGLISNIRRFADKNYLDEMLKLKIKNLKIITTLYAHNSKLQNAITRTPNHFEQKMKAFQNLVNNNIKIEIRIVINSMNYKFLENISKFIIKKFNNKEIFRIIFINMKIYGIAFDNRNFIVPKIKKIIPFLKKGVKILNEKKFEISIYHFPHCILPQKLWKFSKGITAELSEISFLDKCYKCKMKMECSGIWAGYINLFGENEFKPIK